MSAEKETNNSFDFMFLTKKRGKPEKKTKIDSNNLHTKKGIEIYDQKNRNTKKNIDISSQNIKHFFHFDWDNDQYEKESTQISKYITGSLYWYIINSSYFTENLYESNFKTITETYLETGSMNNIQNRAISSENKSLSSGNNNNNNDRDLFKHSPTIINYLYHDKKGKYFQKIFGYEDERSFIKGVRKYLDYYIFIINSLNKEKMNKILEKYKTIRKEFNLKNENINNKTQNNINFNNYALEENYSYQKDKCSYDIRNKFWNYLYKKEKEFLIKREEDNNPKKEFNINSCNICNIEDIDIYNHLYECNQCGIKVHPFCYRMKTDPDPKKWKCSVCKSHSNKEENDLECILCSVKGGAMQRTKISKDSNFYKKIMSFRKNDEIFHNIQEKNTRATTPTHQDSPWIHLSCALWNEDVKIDIYDKKKGIKFDEDNILKKYNSLCHICKLDNYGPTIKCIAVGCNIKCHPECARIKDYYFEIETVDKAFKFCYYCHQHRPNRFIKYLNKSTKTSNDEIFAFSNALDYVYQEYKINMGYDFYSLRSNGQDILSSEWDEMNESEKSTKKFRNKSKYRSRIKLEKKIKRNKMTSNSEKKIVIDLKDNEIDDVNNNNKIQENNNDLIEEHNLGINCVGKIKINSSENDKYNTFNQNNINFTNETNNSIKSNISHNYSNSSENNKISTKFESNIPSTEEQKEEFAINLVKHLKKYFKNNFIFLNKGDSKYSLIEKDEEEEEFITTLLENFQYEDLKKGKYSINKMEFNKEINKRYDEIYKDEDEFLNYYTNKTQMNFSTPENVEQEKFEIKKEDKKEDIIVKKNGCKKRVSKSRKKYF